MQSHATLHAAEASGMSDMQCGWDRWRYGWGARLPEAIAVVARYPQVEHEDSRPGWQLQQLPDEQLQPAPAIPQARYLPVFYHALCTCTNPAWPTPNTVQMGAPYGPCCPFLHLSCMYSKSLGTGRAAC